MLKYLTLGAAVLGLSLWASMPHASAQEPQAPQTPVPMTTEWDKTFPQSDKVDHRKITFHNRYGLTLVADLYKPRGAEGPLPAVAISGPYGASKEQASGFYAQTLAERGFLTIAFDPSRTGESPGNPMNVGSPDEFVEDFSAAVDWLVTSDEVDPERVGIVGICGWGGFALAAAANDPRIKATVTSTMYDMTRVTAYGYFDAMSPDDRYKLREDLARQRTEDYKTGTYAPLPGLPDQLTGDEPQFVQDYYNYYKGRAFHPRSLNSNGNWTMTNPLPYLNFPLLTYIDEIRSPVLMIHGSKAHSLYFSQDAFKQLKGDNKQLLIIEGANHTDLYDNLDYIPFDAIVSFLSENL